MADFLNIDIAYGTSAKPIRHTLQVRVNTTVAEALDQILFEEGFFWRDHTIGIFSRFVTAETLLTADCRIEIYRPLLLDPMQARLARAAKNK